MKKLSILFLLLMPFVLSLSEGCDKIDDLTEVEFDANYDADLDVVVPEAFRNVGFSKTVAIDPLADKNVEKYVDKIKSFNVQSVTGEILEISKDVTLVSGTISVFNSSKQASWSFEKEFLTDETKLTLGNEDGQWTTVNQILGDKKTFSVSVNGEVDEGDVKFKLRVTIKSKVKANPI